MQVPLLDLKAQYATIEDEVREAVNRVFRTQRFILGPEVEALENEVAAYCQCRHGIGVSSGTDALLVALMAIGVEPADEVIVPTFTFFATAGSVARLGARPVFVDCDPLTLNLDPAGVESAVTPRTKAIIPVHLFGLMADIFPVLKIAERHGLAVIEDAAQAIGSELAGRRAGSLGALGCFSFFPSKNLGGCGDGGMVTAEDTSLARKVSCLRDHGFGPKYHNKLLGGNFRLDALQAAILRVKLAHLEEWTRARRANASEYRRLFSEAGLAIDPENIPCLHQVCRGGRDCSFAGNSPGVALPIEVQNRRHIYNQFVVRCAKRDELVEFLRSRGIGCEIYYPIPAHLQECLRGLGCRRGDFPAAECAADSVLALPIYPELTTKMQEFVVGSIADFQSKL